MPWAVVAFSLMRADKWREIVSLKEIPSRVAYTTADCICQRAQQSLKA